MDRSGMSTSELEAVLEQSRFRRRELDSEYETEAAAVQAEADERERLFREQEEEAARKQEEQRAAEQAVLQERARREQIVIGEQEKEDPFADQVLSSGFGGTVSEATDGKSAVEPPVDRSAQAARFGRAQDGAEGPRTEQPVSSPPPAQPPAAPAPPRRRRSFEDDWDDEEDFSQRSWLQ